MTLIKGHLRTFVVIGLLAIVSSGSMYGNAMPAKSDSGSAVRAV